jgi:outer membrane protein
MKFFNLLILSGIICSIVACKQSATAPAASTAAPAAASAGKVVYVNVDSLLSGYNLYNDQRKALEAQATSADKSITAKIEAFQKRMNRFQQSVYETQQKAQTIAPVELKALEQKFAAQQQSLAAEEQSLMKQRDEAAQGIDKKLVELQNKLKSNIDTHLEKVAATKGYDYVLIKGSNGGVLFGKKELDITAEVLKEINAEYAATPKPAQ